MIILNVLIILSSILFSAIFWRIGGDGSPRFRNPGVPILLSVAKFILTGFNPLVFLYIPALWAMLQAISYGLNAPPHKFWVWVFGKGNDGNYRPVEIITRATCGLFWSLPAAIFAYVTGGWVKFGVYVIFLTIANGIIGGTVKDVEVSERGVGACVATSILI
jgi:hypothetical protein